jgi:hypothetical protein
MRATTRPPSCPTRAVLPENGAHKSTMDATVRTGSTRADRVLGSVAPNVPWPTAIPVKVIVQPLAFAVASAASPAFVTTAIVKSVDVGGQG